MARSCPPRAPSPRCVPPAGFGTRWDGGYESGDEISQYYDNLVGKLICWGEDRDTAIARTLRALREFRIEGIATTIPADIAILEHPDFAAAEHSTKWVEDVLDLSARRLHPGAPPTPRDAEAKVRRDVDVEVDGRRFAVKMWVPESQAGAAVAAGAAGARRPPSRRGGSGGGVGAGGGSGAVSVPMQGTIVKVLVEVGQEVEAGATVCVLEAMKMENNITADRAGTIKELKVAAGDSVGSGDVVVVIE